MDIKEIRTKKRALDRQIEELIDKFNKDTGCSITKINVDSKLIPTRTIDEKYVPSIFHTGTKINTVITIS